MARHLTAERSRVGRIKNTTKVGRQYWGLDSNSLQAINNQLIPADQQKPTYSRDFSDLPFMQQPIKNGKAVLKGLPPNRSNSLVIQHPKYTIADAGKRGEVRFTIESSDPKQMAIKTKPIEQ